MSLWILPQLNTILNYKIEFKEFGMIFDMRFCIFNDHDFMLIKDPKRRLLKIHVSPKYQPIHVNLGTFQSLKMMTRIEEALLYLKYGWCQYYLIGLGWWKSFRGLVSLGVSIKDTTYAQAIEQLRGKG